MLDVIKSVKFLDLMNIANGKGFRIWHLSWISWEGHKIRNDFRNTYLLWRLFCTRFQTWNFWIMWCEPFLYDLLWLEFFVIATADDLLCCLLLCILHILLDVLQTRLGDYLLMIARNRKRNDRFRKRDRKGVNDNDSLRRFRKRDRGGGW